VALRSRLRRPTGLDPDGVRALGDDLRAEVERLTRDRPSGLSALFDAARDAAEQVPDLAPWAAWAEGFSEQVRGRTANAEPLLRRAARSFRLRGDDHTAARVDLALMDALACRGNHRGAARVGRRALATFIACDDRPRTVSALHNLGGLAEARDQVRRAVSLWQRARRLIGEDDELRRGVVDTCIASGLQALGRFHEAAELYSGAIRLLHEHKASVIHPSLGLAEVRAMLGEVGEALDRITASERLAAELGDDNLVSEARLLRCRIELDLGHAERALDIATRNVPRTRAAGRTDDVARFAVLACLAVAHGAEGDLERSLAAAETALDEAGMGVSGASLRVALARLGRTPETPDRLDRDIRVLERAGLRVQAELGRLAQAELFARRGDRRRALHLCSAVLQRRHASVLPRLWAHRLRADLAGAAAPTTAVRHLRRALALAESVRGRLSSEADQTAFAARTVDIYTRLVELLLAHGTARSRRQAFELVARVKSRALVEALDRCREDRWQGSPELMRRWDAVRRELGAMLSALENGHGEHSRYSRTVVENRVRQVSRTLEDLELEVARSHRGLGVVLGHRPPPALRTLLEPGEVYLELFLAGPDLFVFALTRSGLRVSRQAAARHEVEKLVAAVRFQLSKAAFGRRHLETPGAFLVDQARSQLAALGERLLAPLLDLPQPRALYLAPHGPLHHLPCAALELGGSPILTKCPVAVVPGSGILSHLLSHPCPRPFLLGVAAAAPASLPEIEREVTEIAQVLPAARVVRSARVADVRELLAECDAVHVASHGAFQPLVPAGSGIRLCDGWLTALDLLRSPVRARLVSLGACASGEVEVTPGEEIAGVVRALLASGVQAAVVAPGALDDLVARRAARLFYDTVLSAGPGAALRHTLLSLREEYPHPALWAGLQLYGNPRPWEDEP